MFTRLIAGLITLLMGTILLEVGFGIDLGLQNMAERERSALADAFALID